MKIFLIFIFIVYFIKNLDFYNELLYEIYLYFNMFDKLIYIDNNVGYILVIMHLAILKVRGKIVLFSS